MPQPNYFLDDKPWFVTPKHNYIQKTATIIGGGLAGVAIAYFLSEKDWDITLIERHEHLATQASGNEAGVFMPILGHIHDPLHQLSTAAFQFGVEHFTSLKHHVNMDLCGVIQLHLEQNKPLETQSDLFSMHSANEIDRLAGITIGRSGYYIKQGGWVSPKQLTEYYVRHSKYPISIQFAHEALSLHQTNNYWQIHDAESNIINESSVVILANSYDVNHFAQSSFIPIRKIRGQNNYVPANSDSLKLKTVISDQGILLPAIDNQHIIGASFVPDDTNCEVRSSESQTNLEHACPILPALFNQLNPSELKGRAAIRAASGDRIPFVGNLPIYSANINHYADINHGNKFKTYPTGSYYKGLYVSSGYGSRGITTIPYCSHLLSQLINKPKTLTNHEQTLLTLTNPIRFIIRALKKNKAKLEA
ncbi:MAG: FAD-dependent 5-carboxymethylaminomethyl-2-thiouridine(34) oxidoreductase MnmC [Rickettsiales bacterium]|nr:FAD-dependent 5-carboxymethylaminomethyl-2-thiouridine(34) oxidoreductase MnmC [Rickettsiales bacterium]